MALVKNQLMKEQEEEFEQELSYQEWLRDNMQESSELEITRMAKEFLEPYTIENFFLYVFSMNNVEYIPTTKTGE
ncbi:hypothetical protein [Sulfurimonas sp.]|uniref:hypothetical protein n=1 Tax=Sulfurimonas sp. TaxID=2022749 RepID=UPI00356B2CBE